LFIVVENIVRVSYSLDPGGTPSYSAFHPDPSVRMWDYGRDRQDKGLVIAESLLHLISPCTVLYLCKESCHEYRFPVQLRYHNE